MTFAAVGSTDTGTTTITLDPANVGDLLVVVWNCVSSTVYVDSVSGGNCTWTQLGSAVLSAVIYSGSGVYSTAWAGKATATGSATLTAAFSGATPGIVHGAAQEFSSSVGSWALDTWAGASSTGGESPDTYPALTPAGAGELYFSYLWNLNNGADGSTSGYTYFLDSANNMGCFDPACTSATQQPLTGQTGNSFGGIAVLMKETAAFTAPPNRPPRRVASRTPAGLIYV